jgi:hypothetical protein
VLLKTARLESNMAVRALDAVLFAVHLLGKLFTRFAAIAFIARKISVAVGTGMHGF